MKSIFACKLYKASPRKDKIQCAIKNPINAELVAQLSEYLDEEYRTPDLSADLDKVDLGDGSSTGGSSGGESSGDFSGMADIPLGGGFSEGESYPSSDDIDLDDETLDSESGDIDDEHLDQDLDEDLEDVTDVEEDVESVESSQGIEVTVTSGLSSETVEQIKGTLNTRDDTTGVNRVLIKNNELWIYYEDSINLNNVMGPAIELLNASGYTYLEFNRLARSANAIVFQICVDDTNKCVKPLEGDLDA